MMFYAEGNVVIKETLKADNLISISLKISAKGIYFD